MTGFYMKCNIGLKSVTVITYPGSDRKLMSLIYRQMNNLPKGLSNKLLKALYILETVIFLGQSKIYQKNTGQTN